MKFKKLTLTKYFGMHAWRVRKSGIDKKIHDMRNSGKYTREEIHKARNEMNRNNYDYTKTVDNRAPIRSFQTKLIENTKNYHPNLTLKRLTKLGKEIEESGDPGKNIQWNDYHSKQILDDKWNKLMKLNEESPREINRLKTEWNPSNELSNKAIRDIRDRGIKVNNKKHQYINIESPFGGKTRVKAIDAVGSSFYDEDSGKVFMNKNDNSPAVLYHEAEHANRHKKGLLDLKGYDKSTNDIYEKGIMARNIPTAEQILDFRNKVLNEEQAANRAAVVNTYLNPKSTKRDLDYANKISKLSQSHYESGI